MYKVGLNLINILTKGHNEKYQLIYIWCFDVDKKCCWAFFKNVEEFNILVGH